MTVNAHEKKASLFSGVNRVRVSDFVIAFIILLLCRDPQISTIFEKGYDAAIARVCIPQVVTIVNCKS